MTEFTIQREIDLTFKEVERVLLKFALERHKYNIDRVSKALGVSRSTIYKKAILHFGVSAMDLKRAWKSGIAQPIEQVVIA